MVDAGLTGNLMQSVSFYANTTIYIIAGLIAIAGTLDRLISITGDLPFARVQTREIIEAKLFLLIGIFIFAYFKFTWALRQYNFLSILIGSAPDRHSPPEVGRPARRPFFDRQHACRRRVQPRHPCVLLRLCRARVVRPSVRADGDLGADPRRAVPTRFPVAHAARPRRLSARLRRPVPGAALPFRRGQRADAGDRSVAMPRTARQVIVDQPGRLHERVAIVEPTNLKPRCARAFASASDSGVFAGTSDSDRHALRRGAPPTKVQTHASKLPNSRCTARKALRVADGALDLAAMADDAGVRHQPVDARASRSGRRGRGRSRERGAVAVALVQDRRPRQPSLRALEHQELEEHAVVVHRHAPLGVVVRTVGIAAFGPGAADGSGGHGDRHGSGEASV